NLKENIQSKSDLRIKPKKEEKKRKKDKNGLFNKDHHQLQDLLYKDESDKDKLPAGEEVVAEEED
ncbi:hypothetical protein KI387_005171, partial [Taxus chinensis]